MLSDPCKHGKDKKFQKCLKTCSKISLTKLQNIKFKENKILKKIYFEKKKKTSRL